MELATRQLRLARHGLPRGLFDHRSIIDWADWAIATIDPPIPWAVEVSVATEQNLESVLRDLSGGPDLTLDDIELIFAWFGQCLRDDPGRADWIAGKIASLNYWDDKNIFHPVTSLIRDCWYMSWEEPYLHVLTGQPRTEFLSDRLGEFVHLESIIPPQLRPPPLE